MHKQTATQAITLSPVNDLTQQIESGIPFDQIQFLLPGGKVRRSLSSDEIILLQLNIPRGNDGNQ